METNLCLYSFKAKKLNITVLIIISEGFSRSGVVTWYLLCLIPQRCSEEEQTNWLLDEVHEYKTDSTHAVVFLQTALGVVGRKMTLTGLHFFGCTRVRAALHI